MHTLYMFILIGYGLIYFTKAFEFDIIRTSTPVNTIQTISTTLGEGGILKCVCVGQNSGSVYWSASQSQCDKSDTCRRQCQPILVFGKTTSPLTYAYRDRTYSLVRCQCQVRQSVTGS